MIFSILNSNRKTYFVDVILPLSVPNYYSYRLPFELNNLVKVGQRVIVPLGRNKLYTAIVNNVHENIPSYPTKYIEYILDEFPIVTANQLALWDWIASYYMCHIGEVMIAALPSSLKLASETKIVRNTFSENELYRPAVRSGNSYSRCFRSCWSTFFRRCGSNFRQKGCLSYCRSNVA